MTGITLIRLTDDDREQFILDNQYAFKYGVMDDFGKQNKHFEEEGEIISRKTIENSIDSGFAYRIRKDGVNVGGLVLRIDQEQHRGELMLLFVNPKYHNNGIGYSAWMAVEKMYPEIDIWETCTPYFEKRNIHFYVNQCGFHIVEFFCAFHNSSQYSASSDSDNPDEDDEMFRFEKNMLTGDRL